MNMVNEQQQKKIEKQDPDWYDRIIKAGLLVVGILGIVQDRSWWLPYVLLFVLLLLSYHSAKSSIERWKRSRLQKRALKKYSADFTGYVLQFSQFVEDSNIYSLPFYLRNILTKLDSDLGSFGSNVEYIFGTTLRHLKSRISQGFRSYQEFDRTSSEFAELVSALVIVYVEGVIHLVKIERHRDKLGATELAEMKKRYEAFLRLIESYNGFRSTVAAFLAEKSATGQIRVPYQALE